MYQQQHFSIDQKIEELEAKRQDLLTKYYEETDEKKKEEIKLDGTIIKMRIKALQIAKGHK